MSKSNFEIHKVLMLNGIHVPLDVYNKYSAEKGIGAWDDVDEYSIKIAVPSIKSMVEIPWFAEMPDVLKNLINVARENKCTHIQLVKDDIHDVYPPSKFLNTFARPETNDQSMIDKDKNKTDVQTHYTELYDQHAEGVQTYYAELCDQHAEKLRVAGDIRGAVGASECAELIRRK